MSKFANFPKDAYLRIFHASRILIPEERAQVEAALDRFLGQWSAHEAPVAGAYEILHDRFVVVSADESKTALSGCSKDSLTGMMRDLGAPMGIEFVHAPPMCFRKGNLIHCVSRDEFADLVESGEVSGDTIVFDLTILSVGPYLAGKFELPARDCWHGRAYDLAGA